MDPARATYWQSKLRGFRLGAEPVEVQLRRRFYAMIVITGLTASIGMILLAIIAGFGRVDIGFKLFSLVLFPATAWFWMDYAILRHRVRGYLLERAESTGDAPPG